MGPDSPTTNWQPDVTIADRYGVLIPADTPSGSCTVEIGLYDFNNVRLRISSNGDALSIARVDVTGNK